MIKKIIWVSAITIPMAFHSMANNHIMLDKANQSYHNQAYQQAATWYQQMIDDGYRNADILYNAGNAYYRCGKKGLAIKCYQESLMEKRNQRTIDNLNITRKAVYEPIYPRVSMHNNLLSVLNMLPINSWSLASLLSFMALVIWIIGTWQKRINRKAMGIVLGTIYLITTAGMIVAYYFRTISYPMVITEEKVRFKAKNGSSRNYLYDGTEVRFIKKSNEGTLIELATGEQGWVNSGALARW
jgi:tetratricopeptide (TPR) repeat protein